EASSNAYQSVDIFCPCFSYIELFMFKYGLIMPNLVGRFFVSEELDHVGKSLVLLLPAFYIMLFIAFRQLGNIRRWFHTIETSLPIRTCHFCNSVSYNSTCRDYEI